MNQYAKPRLLAIVGPTASGKSDMALLLAQQLRGEIICLDSMQVYHGLDIGTAKPTAQEQAQIPHHMLDVVDASQPYCVAQYAQDAQRAIHAILSRGKLPILCGGTGLYLRALSYPLTFGHSAGDEGLRARYQQYLDAHGAGALHALLFERDPVSAQRLHPNDTRRVIRALEVQELTGRPLSSQRMPQAADSPWDMRLFAPDWPRDALYARIDARAHRMAQAGLFEEVAALLAQGILPDAQSMQGLGYKEAVPYLKGEVGRDQTISLIAQRTRNYAKRQLTWFRADPRIQWLPGGQDAAQSLAQQIALLWEET